MIVNRRTAVFVTRTKHVLVARDQGWSPAQTLPNPFLKDKGKRIRDETGKQPHHAYKSSHYKISGILPIWPMAGKGNRKGKDESGIMKAQEPCSWLVIVLRPGNFHLLIILKTSK